MSPRKAAGAKSGALAGFTTVDSIPPATRSSWATRALSQFMEEDDKYVACKFANDKAAISKQASLNKAAKAAPYAGKVKIHRRGDTIYLERL